VTRPFHRAPGKITPVFVLLDDDDASGSEEEEEEGENVEGYGAGGVQTVDEHIPGGKLVHRKGGCRADF
jgi:hypothetical protein